MPTFTTHTATRDAILATRTGSLSGYWVTSNPGAAYAVLGPAGPDAVYAMSPRTGNIVHVVRTGVVDVRGKGRQVRVRVEFPTDTGDAAGTLAFDGGHTGGIAPRVVFA